MFVGSFISVAPKTSHSLGYPHKCSNCPFVESPSTLYQLHPQRETFVSLGEEMEMVREYHIAFS